MFVVRVKLYCADAGAGRGGECPTGVQGKVVRDSAAGLVVP